MGEKILVASSSLDEATFGPVVSLLENMGQDVVVYEADKVADGSVMFEAKVTNESGLELDYGGVHFCLEAVKAAWFRRTETVLSTNNPGPLAVDAECQAIQNGIWGAIPDDVWLNAPNRNVAASKKIRQLDQAIRLGFAIPETVVTNNWHSIAENLPSEVIFKAARPLLLTDERVLTLFTTKFDNTLDELPRGANPFPGIWQELLPKAREWRITAVGDETFDAAIYTTEEAKDDWRKHQSSGTMVEFRREKFPDELKEKCLMYLGEMGLRFGAFDFIEQPDGAITFLECNPNGQYRWLEEQLGLPISAAIANELVKIAKD